MSETVDFTLLAKSDAGTRTYAAGETIFAQGDQGSELFVVRSGEVQLIVGERVVETVGPQGTFGEMAIIDAAPRSATAVAASKVELVAVNEKQFLFFVSEMPFFALNLLRVMARRIRHANQQV